MTASRAELKDLSSGVLDEIESARGDLIDLCANLVSVASVNPPGRTVEVAEVVRSYLSSFQIMTTTVKADDNAPNLVADVMGRSGGGHVIFNAHMDTMEASDPSAWSVPVFQLTRRGGRLYGLGMGNMKGALAAMCLATAVLHRHRTAWSGRLSMTAVSDEVMFGERGTVHLLRARPDLAGDFLISGEGPGFMQLGHQRFASDPHIAGRITRINNRPVTIVGVAPDLTTGWLTPPNVWLPFTAQPYMDSSRNGFTMTLCCG